jgi:hypothetical protein
VQRGSITFWFCQETVEKWRHDNTKRGVGHPYVYSDTAITCLLALRELFQLPYRQTVGLGKSLVELMQIEKSKTSEPKLEYDVKSSTSSPTSDSRSSSGISQQDRIKL